MTTSNSSSGSSPPRFQSVFAAYDRRADRPGLPQYAFAKADRRVSVFYFYIWDDDFGPGFIKICSYFPYPAKVWVNGHEWAKRQATRAGLSYNELANGFAAVDDPDRLQAICDRLGPVDIEAFFDRWMRVIPTPLSDQDRQGGYWWELSMRQVEVSRTIVFDAPRRGRAFFEAVVADNVGLGRPSEVRVIFDRRIRKDTKGTFRTRVMTRGVDVCVDINYRDSRVKQYLKEGRALRIETVVNSHDDLGVKRRLVNLDELQAKDRAVDARLLATQKAGQDCAISARLFERVAQPTLHDGQRVSALRFGDPRVMALAASLCVLVHTVVGFTNRSLCAQVRSLLGGPYTSTQTTYDLRRLRLKGLIRRIDGQSRYVLTSEGIRVAAFYTKVHPRLLEPSSKPTNHPRPPSCVEPSAPSTPPSTTTSRTLGSHPQHETCLKSQQPRNQGALGGGEAVVEEGAGGVVAGLFGGGAEDDGHDAAAVAGGGGGDAPAGFVGVAGLDAVGARVGAEQVVGGGQL